MLDTDIIFERNKELFLDKQKTAKAFVLRAQISLADIGNKNRFDEAERYFGSALGASRDPEILFAYEKYYSKYKYDLARQYGERGEYSQQEKSYEETIRLYREINVICNNSREEYHWNLASTLHNLGALHSDTGKYDQAETEYKEALKLWRLLIDHDYHQYNQDGAATLYNLGNLYRDTGRQDKAKTAYTEAFRRYRELIDNGYTDQDYHTCAANALYNLAELHSKTGKHEQAEKQHKEALRLYMGRLGHKADKLHINIYASTHAEEQYTEALQNKLKIATENPGLFNPNVATILNGYYISKENLNLSQFVSELVNEERLNQMVASLVKACVSYEHIQREVQARESKGDDQDQSLQAISTNDMKRLLSLEDRFKFEESKSFYEKRGQEEYIISKAQTLPYGWVWLSWDDGSSGLYSPDGREYAGIDSDTGEYHISRDWNFYDKEGPDRMLIEQWAYEDYKKENRFNETKEASEKRSKTKEQVR